MSENNPVSVKNKKAFFEYEVLDKYVAGMQLLGTEIKSIRDGKAGLTEAYCTFVGEELYVIGLHIGIYKNAGQFNNEEKRDRKLLLERRELDKLHKKVKEALSGIKRIKGTAPLKKTAAKVDHVRTWLVNARCLTQEVI